MRVEPVERSHQFQYRLFQGIRHLTSKPDHNVDEALKALLTDSQWSLVRRLAPADRVHLFTVHRELVRMGMTDQDLLTAAILHDVGKADERGRVTLLHRVVKVLLEAVAPNWLERMSRQDDNWLRHGLYLALNHPRLGAALAREAGISDRTCWLIEHHADDTISGDDELRALQTVDARE
jgi:hypothetical protein